MKRIPYKLNVPGDFFVEDGQCISCTLPFSESPNLIGEDEDPEVGYHCYFKKQPKSEGDIQDAINAMEVACCGALYYKGNNKRILAKLKALNLGAQIDSE